MSHSDHRPANTPGNLDLPASPLSVAQRKKVAPKHLSSGSGTFAKSNASARRSGPQTGEDSSTRQLTGRMEELADGVTRLISETAHDLRSPLTTIREAVRLVQNGDMGPLNEDQSDLLRSAIDQCDCMNSMVNEMSQMERLRTGTPRANRQWISLEKVQSVVDETLRPWAMPRQIDLLWDIAPDSSARVYADPSMVRRLIVNLVVNAIRASQDGQCVLIRFSRAHNGETIRCGVIDQGRGIGRDDLERLKQDRGSSIAVGEGLGLAICRQLAAVHFSSLRLRSRLGDGTEVSFELPAAGPHSVASSWVRWRLTMRPHFQKPHRAAHDQTPLASMTHGSGRPSSSANIAELNHRATHPRFDDQITLGTVSLGAAVSREAGEGFEKTLQNQMQMFDLAYQIDHRRWIWIFDADVNAATERIDAIKDRLANQGSLVRATWSSPKSIPLDPRRALARVSDLMVRETLSASSSNHIPLDQNEVRPGTAPIELSDVATERLNVEMRRLSSQMKSQTTWLQMQSQKLRPKDFS